MNSEFLRAELGRAQDALAESADQVRQLLPMLADAAGSSPSRSASDAQKLIMSALALHQRCTDYEGAISKRLESATKRGL